MEQYSKYKLFRKYITSNGVDYTPIDDYQAFDLNKKNQCDCGYRIYEKRIDDTICRLNLNEEVTCDEVIKEGNKYIIKPTFRTFRHEHLRRSGFCGAIKIRFKGNGKNVNIHYDIKTNKNDEYKYFITYYYFSKLDRLPIINTYYSTNNTRTAMSYSPSFLPNNGDFTFNVTDNEEHFFIICWDSHFVEKSFFPDEREEFSLQFSDNTSDIFFNAAGPKDCDLSRYTIENYPMFQEMNILNQHALCPDDPSIDEIVPNTTTYEIKRYDSYNCGYLDFKHREKVKTINYSEIPADYPRLTLVEWVERIEYPGQGSYPGSVDVKYITVPECLINIYKPSWDNRWRITKTIKFKTDNNIIPLYYASKLSGEGVKFKLDNYDLHRYGTSLYNIKLEGDKDTIHTLELDSVGNTRGEYKIFLPFFNEGHFYDLNQFTLSRLKDDGTEEIVAVDKYYFSNAIEKERWVIDGTLCNNTNKYNKEWLEVSINDIEWSRTNETRQGELIESNSCDCGGKHYEYRNSGNYICSSELDENFITRVEGNWIKEGNIFTSNKIYDSDKTVERIYFTTNNKNITLKFVQSSENKYDYLIVSKIDTTVVNSTSSPNNFGNASGKTDGTFTILAPTDGKEHFIELMYKKDSSGLSGDDNVIVTFVDFYEENSKYEIWEEWETCTEVKTENIEYRNPVKDCDCGYRTYEWKSSGYICGSGIPNQSKIISTSDSRDWVVYDKTISFYNTKGYKNSSIVVTFSKDTKKIHIEMDVNTDIGAQIGNAMGTFFISSIDSDVNIDATINVFRGYEGTSENPMPKHFVYDVEFPQDGLEHYLTIGYYRNRNTNREDTADLTFDYYQDCKYEVWNQHALCPTDPNIDEIVPNTTEYRNPVKSEECGYIPPTNVNKI